MKDSYWITSCENKEYKSLEKDIDTEYLIVGGGITGLTTAYLLNNENKKVTIVEADRIGWGSSGRNTGKVTSQHGLIYNNIKKEYSLETAKLYYEANEDGLKLVESIIKENNIDCEFKIVSSFIFTEDEKYVEQIEDEYNTCKEINISCKLYNKLDGVPLEIKAALEFKNQGQFNPKKYVDALAKVDKEKGVEIYENTPVIDVKLGKKCELECANGCKIRTKVLIIASSNAWYDGLKFYFSKEEASRSYLLCGKLKEDILEGNFISVEEPTRTFRTYKDEKKENCLIVGGQDHKTGKSNNEMDIYNIIEEYAKSKFNIEEVLCSWSAQDYVSFDKIPYIGKINMKEDNVYIVTGTSKWGLSNGSAGAIVIKDLITKKYSKYEELYNPSRLKSYLNTKFLEANMEVAFDYIKGKLISGSSEMPKNKNEGKVVSIHGKRYGAYRDEIGELFIVDITCTHLGCELRFNSGDKSWDCPCHGSRFDYKGNILNGPALKPLKRYGQGKNDIDPKLI
ncbi:MAG: FAD-dependent oxidoreductase [Terrisporobacter sp.]